MKFDVDDENRCRLVCVKFHLNRCRFAAAVAKCLGGSLFLGHSVIVLRVVNEKNLFYNLLITLQLLQSSVFWHL